MKKILAFLLLLSLQLPGCQTISHYRKVKKISAERAVEECTGPRDFHMVPPTSFGVTIRIMRHKDCMGVSDMLMMLWDGDKTELNETVVKAVMLMYIDSINYNNKVQIGRVFLKYDVIESGLHIKFYELVVVDPEDYKGEDD
tara:strand:- start:305 stop:730 length:426 start_codon:yes stop_codon:yes gene_type:complete